MNPFSRRRMDILFQTNVKTQRFNEVVFVVGDVEREFKVNLATLSQISGEFKGLLHRPIYKIKIPDANPDAFDSIIQYSYGNGPQLTDDNIAGVHYLCCIQNCHVTKIS